MTPPSDALCRVALSICSGIRTPLAAQVCEYIREQKWADLAKLRVHPSSYVCREMYFSDVVAASLLRKLPMPTGIQTDKVALTTWKACEKTCKGTNMRMSAVRARIEYPLADDQNDRLVQAQLTLVKCVRKWVARLLGPAPKGVIPGRPSKKATYEMRFANSSLLDKFAKNPAHTPNLRWPSASVDWQATAWCRSFEGSLLLDGPPRPRVTSSLPQVEGNRFSTVPKDGTTDRPIACEPTLNVYAQLGVGGALKGRLRRWGLLATKETCGFESQAWHRQLAQKASIDGDLVTIDLSSASDTVAYSTVQLLFAEEWVKLFTEFRSPKTLVVNRGEGGRPVKGHESFFLEKLSSMGNGFTFEVETALFSAIAAASMELVGLEPRFPHNVSVYGDDILVPKEASKMLLNALTFFGFIPNMNKSFTTGPFRESCGGDYWDGVDVRPVFFEKDPKGPLDWISVHNKIARLAKRGIPVGPALQLCREQLPTRLRSIYGPDYLGDIVLHDPYGLEQPITKVIWSSKPREPSGYGVLKVVLPVNPSINRSRWDDETVLVAMLYGCQERVPDRDPFKSDEIIGYRTAWISWG